MQCGWKYMQDYVEYYVFGFVLSYHLSSVKSVPWSKTMSILPNVSNISNAFHDKCLSIIRCVSVQVKRLPRGSTGVPERSFTLQVPPNPQQSSSQGLPPHSFTLSSASVPGRTSAPLNRRKCQRMSQPTTNSLIWQWQLPISIWWGAHVGKMNLLHSDESTSNLGSTAQYMQIVFTVNDAHQFKSQLCTFLLNTIIIIRRCVSKRHILLLIQILSQKPIHISATNREQSARALVRSLMGLFHLSAPPLAYWFFQCVCCLPFV